MKHFIVIIAVLLQTTFAFADQGNSTHYQRKFFGSGWRDTDGDCLNTRHELLKQLSTSVTLRMATNGCRVVGGKWFGNYSGKTFNLSADLDIDHLVPLKWAWSHGASDWTKDQRKQFANDLRFIIPVESSLNRSKGAKSPLDWLPPNQSFQCQYLLKFQRAILVYDFQLDPHERAAMKRQRNDICTTSVASTS